MISEAGHVGIGTTRPRGRLHINSGNTNGELTGLILEDAVGNMANGNGSKILWQHKTGTAIRDLAEILGSIKDNKGEIYFRTSNGSNIQDRVVINEAGNVGIGTTRPQGRLHVNGRIQCTGLFKVSDISMKKNITLIDNALAKVTNLRGVKFEWNKEDFPEQDFEDGRKIGMIAQEVEHVLPEIVSTDTDGYKSVDYASIVPVLVEAIKAQQIQINALLVQNEEFKTRIAELESIL